MIPRAQIIDCARSWIGTPYHHQASARHIGCDCLGLVRGVWREIYGEEPLVVPPYTPDWAEASGSETLLNAARQCLTEIPLKAARPGDAILFRMTPNVPAKHIAILSAEDQIIHAYWARFVTESRLIPYWRRRQAYAFSFPDIESLL